MATARDLIHRSLRLIHVLDPGEDPTPDEANDSLTALNDMLDSMSVPGLYIYAIKEDVVSWPAGQESRTIGASGDFNITRPTRLEDSTFFTAASGDDYPLKIIRSRSAYSGIYDKDTSTDFPEFLYYEPSFPLGKLFIWPVPSIVLSISLHSQEQLTQLTTLDTALSIPPGYKELLTALLCARLAPEFGVALPPEAQDIMRRASRAVRRANTRNVYSQVEAPGMGGTYNIYSDS